MEPVSLVAQPLHGRDVPAVAAQHWSDALQKKIIVIESFTMAFFSGAIIFNGR